jgi:hypothetical protein
VPRSMESGGGLVSQWRKLISIHLNPSDFPPI